VLNVPREPGRRRALKATAAAELVRVWIDDAVELLAGMPASCSLDEADAGALGRMAVASNVGRSREGIRQVRRVAIAALARARQAEAACR